MIKSIQMDLEYMPYIPAPKQTPKQLFNQAASNDEVTCNSWRDVWIGNAKANHESHGPFKDHNIGSLYGKAQGKACLVAGSGPSLGNNVDQLKDRGNIPLISVLHNFHYMVDNEVDVDYYVSLDAGNVTIEEISEGGEHDHEYYLEKSKDCTLLCFIGTHPDLLKSWKGKVLFFNCPIPDKGITEAINAIEKFDIYVSNGGNVLGAATYIAKIMGAMTVGFLGADFCFDYMKNFHPWKSKYDGNVGNAVRVMNVHGHSNLTWGSYYNFKCWFEYVAMTCPGIWVNCSEGGTLGAHQEGNIQQIIQMQLAYFINAHNLNEPVKYQYEHPENGVDPKAGQINLLF
jgi:hypothetical protein